MDYTMVAKAVVFAFEQHRGQKRVEAEGIVAELTNDSRLPKAERHEDMLRRMAAISPEAKLIKLADRYDNLRTVAGSEAGKRERILLETPRMLESLQGTCPALESAIEELLQVMRG